MVEVHIKFYVDWVACKTVKGTDETRITPLCFLYNSFIYLQRGQNK